MKMNFTLIFLLAAAATLLLASPALAYLDPVSTSFILNSIAAGIFGALFFIKLNWQKFKGLFTRKSAEAESPPAEGEQVEK